MIDLQTKPGTQVWWFHIQHELFKPVIDYNAKGFVVAPPYQTNFRFVKLVPEHALQGKNLFALSEAEIERLAILVENSNVFPDQASCEAAQAEFRTIMLNGLKAILDHYGG